MYEINPFRTTDELKDSTFNYFIAFKINLKETDKTKIELQVKKILSDPKGSVQSRRLFELRNDIMEIMCNDSIYDSTTGTYKQNAGGRAKEAEAAKSLKIEEALEIIKILCSTRKWLLKSEIKKIYDSANSPFAYFTEAEFDNAIKPLLSVDIKIIDNLDTSIPFDKYQKTEQRLKPLDKKDLYDFLGCKTTDSTFELEDKNNEQYKNSQKISDLKKKQAIGGLCCMVKDLLLSSPQSRKNYDIYVEFKDDVWACIEKRRVFGIKELTISEYEKYLNLINKVINDIDYSNKILAIACKFYQMTILEDIKQNDLIDYVYCPYCGKKLVK